MKVYNLTLAAEEDLLGIWRDTFDKWGFKQAENYFDQIEACCEAVGNGQTRSRKFDQLSGDVRIYRCKHHYIIWMGENLPTIIAILHERMDFMHRLEGRVS